MASASSLPAQVVSITKMRQDSLPEQARIAREAGTWTRCFTKEGVHPFDEIEWKSADAEIRNPQGKIVFQQKGIEVPAWWTQNNINIVADKYFRVINGIRETSVKQIFSRVCSTLRRWASEQNYFDSEKDAQVYEDELLFALVHQYGAFNSPVWFNLGVPGRSQAASACFIQDVNDSLEDIMKYQAAEITIFRAGSGSGANLSKLRSSYEKISSGSYTSGPMSWMEGSDAYAKAMKSGGSTRNAAKMNVLDMDHPDILVTRDGRPGFIRCKAEEEVLAHKLVESGYGVDYDDPNGAYKRIRYQAANHSVSIPDAFMQSVYDDAIWQTTERRSGKVVHTYKARDLWNEIAKAAWTCGDPGVQYTDTINKWHTTPKSGPIRASNPCLRAGSRLLTKMGWRKIEDLSDQDSVDIWDGYQFVSGRVWKTGRKPIVRITTNNGRSLDLTGDHQVMTGSGWLKAENCESVTIPYATPVVHTGESCAPYWRCVTGASGFYYGRPSATLMEALGFLQGDGTIADGHITVCFTEEKDGEIVREKYAPILADIAGSSESECVPAYSSIRSTFEICRNKLSEWLESLGCSKKTLPDRLLPSSLWQLPSAAQSSFLRGLFAANGNVLCDSVRAVRLVSTCRAMLGEVQLLLQTFGIHSSVRRHNKEQSILWSNGEYVSRESFHLEITTQEDLFLFAKYIGFPQSGQVEKLYRAIRTSADDSNSTTRYRRESMEIVSVERLNIEDDVYDFTVPTTHYGVANGIIVSNCSEFLHIDNTACNLCAINLTKFFDGRKFVASRFEQSVRLFSTAQMAIIAKADYPTDEISANSHKYRPIGTNYGDLGALVMKLGYSYDSNEGRAVAAYMASLMTGIVYITSAKLAARVGAFPDFELNREDMIRVMKMHQEADASIQNKWQLDSCPLGDDVVSTSASVWREAISLGEKFGYNVSQASLQAPLGTISFLMGMSTTGVEPAFSIVSYKQLVGGGTLKLVNSGVRDALQHLGYAIDQIESICKHVEETDGIEGSKDLHPAHLPIFDCALASRPGGRFLSPLAHIKMMAAIQPLITCAISKTVNLPSDITPAEIASVYEESWRLGLKCIALYRDGCKASQPLSARKEVELKLPDAPVAPPAATPVDTLIAATKIATRRDYLPSEISSWRHKFEIDGYKGYLIVGEYEDGRPGEVFLKLGKPGSTIAGLIDGFTKLMSIALQYGVPLPVLIQSFVDTRFEPAGITSNKSIRFALSLYDYLFKVLDVRYYKGRYSGLAERLKMVLDSAPAQNVREGMTKEPVSSTHRIIEDIPVKQKKSLDAPFCTRCGGVTQRNGSCYLCPACGQTTGCS